VFSLDKLIFEKKTMYKRCEVLGEDERGKSKTRTFTGKFRKNFINLSHVFTFLMRLLYLTKKNLTSASLVAHFE
jgi:hypothetical protein